MTADIRVQSVEQDRNLAALNEAIVAAEYPVATQRFVTMLRSGYTPQQLMGSAIGAAAPYVQIPQHIMFKPDGQSRGVNYDHTILAWRGSERLGRHLQRSMALLPLAQAMWYTPQGLDVWSQINCEFPGHYARDAEKCGEREPFKSQARNPFNSAAWQGPKTRFEDQEPLVDGSIEGRIRRMLDAIFVGEKAESYRLFLGLAAEPEARDRLKEATLFAGIIDIQDSIILKGGYQNIGHKALRARALIDLADTLGWENAHDVFYTVVPDQANMPRFFELWAITTAMMPQEFRNWSTLKRDNQSPIREREIDELIDAVVWSAPADVMATVTRLLRAGRAVQSIGDAVVIAYMRHLIHDASHPNAFLNPGHAFDYANVVHHWFRSYDNPHQAKALYFEALFVNDVIRAERLFPRDPAAELESPEMHRARAETLTPNELLVELNEAATHQETPRAMAMTDAYLRRTDERMNLIATLGQVGATIQNDPHIARLCMSSIEEYHHNSTSRRDDILRGWTKYLTRAVRRTQDGACFELYRSTFGV